MQTGQPASMAADKGGTGDWPAMGDLGKTGVEWGVERNCLKAALGNMNVVTSPAPDRHFQELRCFPQQSSSQLRSLHWE